jgi:hypothetical protein
MMRCFGAAKCGGKLDRITKQNLLCLTHQFTLLLPLHYSNNYDLRNAHRACLALMSGPFIVREAQLEDVPQIATINGDAFENDELWRWLSPDAEDYPFLNRNRLVHNARSDVLNPKVKIVVAETTGSDKMIVGFATWNWTLNKHEKVIYSESWSGCEFLLTTSYV